MTSPRKTKDCVCRKCGKPNRVPVEYRLTNTVCARRTKDGSRCLGQLVLVKKEK